MRARRVIAFGLSAIVLAAGVVLSSAVPGTSVVSAAAATSAYIPLTEPQRLLDTRRTTWLAAGATVSVPVAGPAPLPEAGTVVAAVLNLTVAAPAGPGYFTVWPHAQPRPNASTLNIDELRSLTGGALPNLVTVPVGADGVVDVFSSSGGHVIVDLLGYYAPATSATAGRFEPLASPTRVLDTRGKSTFAAGEARTFEVPGAAGASAVAVNLTAVTTNPGYWQAYAAGAAAPVTSNLNSPVGIFAKAANQAIVPVDESGSITIFSRSGGDLIIDLLGTYTGTAAPDEESGLFVPLSTPTRILDTRVAALNPLGGTTAAEPGWSIEVPVATIPVVARDDVSAVVVNATSVGSYIKGFVTVGTAGSVAPGATPTTSTMNITRPGQILANHAMVPVSNRGFFVYTAAGGNVVADLAGYFVGTPAKAKNAKPKNLSRGACSTATVGAPTTAVGPIIVGSSGKSVAALQSRLLALGFWNAGADGGYGLSTTQSVMAFQKWVGLPATTVVDESTATMLNMMRCRPAADVPGSVFVVDKSQQIAYVVRDGRVLWIFNVSTGNGQSYDEEDQKSGGRSIGVAITPTGTFHTYREYDVWRYEGTLGSLYRPKFFSGGVAVHGAPRVPNYPASHGCVRVANPVMDLIWSQNLLPLHATVVVHD